MKITKNEFDTLISLYIKFDGELIKVKNEFKRIFKKDISYKNIVKLVFKFIKIIQKHN